MASAQIRELSEQADQQKQQAAAQSLGEGEPERCGTGADGELGEHEIGAPAGTHHQESGDRQKDPRHVD
jgi:hypothetical protein